MKKQECMAVLDVGGTNIKSALIGPDGAVTNFRETPSNAHLGGAALLHTIVDVIREYAGFEAIALSLTGQIDVERGEVLFATPKTIPGFIGAKVKASLEQAFAVPVYVENDVNCAAIGEARSGAGRGQRQFLCVTFGTGIGGAIVQDGRIYHGAHWSAGEFGHMLIHAGKDAVACSCGSHGCYEAYASTAALCRMAERATGVFMNGREIFASLNCSDGDGVLAAVFDEWCTEICYGLVSLVHAFNPPLLVLGGGIMNEKILIEIIKMKLMPMLMPNFRKLEIVPAELGNDAGMLGAWHLAKEAFGI